MNPDILHSIQSGDGHVSVYLTAGDAGQDEEYWEGREDGIKAAYGEMAGANDWVDTEVTLSNGEDEVTIASSYLESQPEVRLYFLRLPDGYTATESGYTENMNGLEQLWDGDIQTVTSIDGANSYSGGELVGTLHALLEFHEPETVMIQDHQTEFSDHSHADHVHGSMFAQTAYEFYADDHQHDLVGYVDYASSELDPNVSGQDHAQMLDTFLAYAGHDENVRTGSTEDGTPILNTSYLQWLERQYYTEEFASTHDHEDPAFELETSDFTVQSCGCEDGSCDACQGIVENPDLSIHVTPDSPSPDAAIASDTAGGGPDAAPGPSGGAPAGPSTLNQFLAQIGWTGGRFDTNGPEHSGAADPSNNVFTGHDPMNRWLVQDGAARPGTAALGASQEQPAGGIADLGALELMSALFTPMPNEHEYVQDMQLDPEDQQFLPEL
ncbi:hypothetical protein EI983_10525 [Roseovarius faecimaris]|uniref:PIG-L family deacetylase n=1 Tax=Roseovarius faecimaris TaxID=2494550 RepID=A0A6I6IR33_9RHOB|nr:PIG-L family deacetylase [Roseovarius faecimaris]QGX98682.1 hypothetical protein EI983_10525 [Roseovarius faecimaris]